jgi:hypothetical protein
MKQEIVSNPLQNKAEAHVDNFLKDIKLLIEKNLAPGVFHQSFDQIAQEFQENLGVPQDKRFSLLDIVFKRLSRSSSGNFPQIPKEDAIELVSKGEIPYYFQIGNDYFGKSDIFFQNILIDADGKLPVAPVFRITENLEEWARDYVNERMPELCPTFGFKPEIERIIRDFEFIAITNTIYGFNPERVPLMLSSLASSNTISFKHLKLGGPECVPIALDVYNASKSISSTNRSISLLPSENNNDFLRKFTETFSLPDQFSDEVRSVVNATALNYCKLMIIAQMGSYLGGRERYMLAEQQGCFAEAPIPEVKNVCYDSLANTILTQAQIELAAIALRTLVKGVLEFRSQDPNERVNEILSSCAENSARFGGYLINSISKKSDFHSLFGGIFGFSSIITKLSYFSYSGDRSLDDMEAITNNFNMLSSPRNQIRDRNFDPQATLNSRNYLDILDDNSKIMMRQFLFIAISHMVGDILSEDPDFKETNNYKGKKDGSEILAIVATSLLSGILMVASQNSFKKIAEVLEYFSRDRDRAQAQVVAPAPAPAQDLSPAPAPAQDLAPAPAPAQDLAPAPAPAQDLAPAPAPAQDLAPAPAPAQDPAQTQTLAQASNPPAQAQAQTQTLAQAFNPPAPAQAQVRSDNPNSTESSSRSPDQDLLTQIISDGARVMAQLVFFSQLFQPPSQGPQNPRADSAEGREPGSGSRGDGWV